MSILPAIAAAAAALAQPQAQAQGQPRAEAAPAAQPDLDWLAGYWLSCEGGRDVAETWSERRGGIMLGTNIMTGPQSFFWEQMRIEAGVPGPGDLSFVAQPRGAAQPTAFRLVRAGDREAVFENPAHDFPQRVIYRRDGDRLVGRIEGRGGEAAEWRFSAAPLNTRCPR